MGNMDFKELKKTSINCANLNVVYCLSAFFSVISASEAIFRGWHETGMLGE